MVNEIYEALLLAVRLLFLIVLPMHTKILIIFGMKNTTTNLHLLLTQQKKQYLNKLSYFTVYDYDPKNGLRLFAGFVSTSRVFVSCQQDSTRNLSEVSTYARNAAFKYYVINILCC